MERSPNLKIMAVLATLQGVLGLLRAYNWVQIGANLFGQGLLLVPFVGVMAVARGVFISIVALLYVLFAIGVFLGKSWAWWPCITAVIINLFLVVGALVQGVPLIEGIAWSVIPAVLLVFFFSQKGDAVAGV
ncbi:MAG TPA: hypothetical protein VFY96_01040 [Candidatus Binatia bacterium]|nr:hypothetical protein [Candidatus Binatia bacterium]